MLRSIYHSPVTANARLFKVYRDAEWNEFVTRFFVDGVHQTKADYHTDTRSDAVSTGDHWLEQQVESVTPAACHAYRPIRFFNGEVLKYAGTQPTPEKIAEWTGYWNTPDPRDDTLSPGVVWLDAYRGDRIWAIDHSTVTVAKYL